MQRFLTTWQALDLRRRLIFAGAGAVAILATLTLGMMASRPDLALLYSGLDPAAAGEVVGALEQMQIASDVRGDAIYVPAGLRDRVRLALARDGIPRQGQAGYELLDQMSGFSTTTDMFNAAYWRAKEGELARTILASPGVRAARVHIAAPSRRPFARQSAEPTASITVTMAGGPLTQAQASAFRYLVALAVAGMTHDQIAVIDSRAGLVLRPGEESPIETAGGGRADREARLKAEIEDLLEARVGRDKVRVSVAVEIDRQAETITEKVIQPDSRVTIHADTEEITDNSSGSNPSVTVASNLPDGEASAQNERRSERNETREKVNYDYSELRRESVRHAGAISRISVGVLVDGITAPDETGALTWRPRPEEELQALRDLVVAAVGFDEKRGDRVTVESMAFQANGEAGESVEAGSVTRFVERNGMELVQIAILAGVIIVLALAVLRPLLLRRPVTVAGDEPGVAMLGAPEDRSAIAAPEPGDEGDPEGGKTRILGIPDRTSLIRFVNEQPAQSIATLREWLDTSDEEAA